MMDWWTAVTPYTPIYNGMSPHTHLQWDVPAHPLTMGCPCMMDWWTAVTPCTPTYNGMSLHDGLVNRCHTLHTHLQWDVPAHPFTMGCPCMMDWWTTVTRYTPIYNGMSLHDGLVNHCHTLHTHLQWDVSAWWTGELLSHATHPFTMGCPCMMDWWTAVTRYTPIYNGMSLHDGLVNCCHTLHTHLQWDVPAWWTGELLSHATHPFTMGCPCMMDWWTAVTRYTPIYNGMSRHDGLANRCDTLHTHLQWYAHDGLVNRCHTLHTHLQWYMPLHGGLVNRCHTLHTHLQWYAHDGLENQSHPAHPFTMGSSCMIIGEPLSHPTHPLAMGCLVNCCHTHLQWEAPAWWTGELGLGTPAQQCCPLGWQCTRCGRRGCRPWSAESPGRGSGRGSWLGTRWGLLPLHRPG